MKIHKEGYLSIIVVGILVIIIEVFKKYYYSEPSTIQHITLFIEIFLFVLVIRFFRIPTRKINQDTAAILSAADGTVVTIEEIQENIYFNEKRIQVSVFMSLLNVHINYYPVSGVVKNILHKLGHHLPAYLPKSSMKNEQNNVLIQCSNQEKILIRQIAGLAARRIVCYAEVNKKIEQGEQIGIIKFGSRVDLILPNSVKINVKLGQKVKAGLDVIAYFK